MAKLIINMGEKNIEQIELPPIIRPPLERDYDYQLVSKFEDCDASIHTFTLHGDGSEVPIELVLSVFANNKTLDAEAHITGDGVIFRNASGSIMDRIIIKQTENGENSEYIIDGYTMQFEGIKTFQMKIITPDYGESKFSSYDPLSCQCIDGFCESMFINTTFILKIKDAFNLDISVNNQTTKYFPPDALDRDDPHLIM